MGGDGAVVLPEVVAGLPGEAAELLPDHGEEAVHDEVGVHRRPGALVATQQGHMIPPRLVDLVGVQANRRPR